MSNDKEEKSVVLSLNDRQIELLNKALHASVEMFEDEDYDLLYNVIDQLEKYE